MQRRKDGELGTKEEKKRQRQTDRNIKISADCSLHFWSQDTANVPTFNFYNDVNIRNKVVTSKQLSAGVVLSTLKSCDRFYLILTPALKTCLKAFLLFDLSCARLCLSASSPQKTSLLFTENVFWRKADGHMLPLISTFDHTCSNEKYSYRVYHLTS